MLLKPIYTVRREITIQPSFLALHGHKIFKFYTRTHLKAVHLTKGIIDSNKYNPIKGKMNRQEHKKLIDSGLSTSSFWLNNNQFACHSSCSTFISSCRHFGQNMNFRTLDISYENSSNNFFNFSRNLNSKGLV